MDWRHVVCILSTRPCSPCTLVVEVAMWQSRPALLYRVPQVLQLTDFRRCRSLPTAFLTTKDQVVTIPCAFGSSDALQPALAMVYRSCGLPDVVNLAKQSKDHKIARDCHSCRIHSFRWKDRAEAWCAEFVGHELPRKWRTYLVVEG